MEEQKEELSSQTPKPLPVDRQWISKLLDKYPNPKSRISNKALVVAPMVDQSDLPFRMLCRSYGANLCFTPMIHSRLLIESPRYRAKFFGKNWDRPLIAQVCGSDPDTVLQAAQLLEPFVDGIDINCGCPQGIAKRGNYGAYLLEQEDTLMTLVNNLLPRLKVPLSVKVRLLPPVTPQEEEDENFDIPQASLNLYTKLVDAGIHLLTIHGRTRYQKGSLTGKADWKTIRRAVDLLGDRIPIFANGSIQDFSDVEECLLETNADGIMSSESVLEYPPIFYKIPQASKRTIGRMQLCWEYLQLAKEYPPDQGGQGSGIKCIRVHIHRFLHAVLQEDKALRSKLVCVQNVQELIQALQECQKKYDAMGHDVATESLSWYLRHRMEKESNHTASFADDDEEENKVDRETPPEGFNNCFFGDDDDGDY